jgi:uncharacterized protein (TIGR03435 family)
MWKSALAIVSVANAVMWAQPKRAAPAQPKFEVASVKRCASPSGGEGEGRGAPPASPDRLRITCWSLAALIRDAYVVFAGGHFNGNNYPTRIEQLPGWGNAELYTVEAKAEGTPGRDRMYGPMLQALLEERFALKIHSETRDEPAYALTVAKGGFKLQPFQGSCIPLDPIHPQGARQDLCPRNPQDSPMSLDVFAWLLGNFKPPILDAPVINKTGITGNFHFNMEALLKLARPPGGAPGSAPSDDPLFASVFTAVRDLGLQLQAAKAPRQFLVVDHAERPSAN